MAAYGSINSGRKYMSIMKPAEENENIEVGGESEAKSAWRKKKCRRRHLAKEMKMAAACGGEIGVAWRRGGNGENVGSG
jgi:hypothetical protein